MMRIATVTAALLMTTGVLAQAPKPKPMTVAQVQASLQGTWVIKTFNGQPQGEQEVALIITADKYAQSVGGTVNERGTYKVDPAKSPMTIDLNIQEGADAGKLQLGVLEIKGDALTCKLNPPGSPTRPSTLAVEEGFFVVVAERRKK